MAGAKAGEESEINSVSICDLLRSWIPHRERGLWVLRDAEVGTHRHHGSRKALSLVQPVCLGPWRGVKRKSLSHVWLFVTPWTVTLQAPLSMELSRQGYWSGLPFPTPGDLPNPGMNLDLLHCRRILYWITWHSSHWWRIRKREGTSTVLKTWKGT